MKLSSFRTFLGDAESGLEEPLVSKDYVKVLT
jgi:hypothetical protein